MDTFNNKLIIYTISLGLILSGCIGLILFYFFPSAINWNWYIAIVSYFLIIETCIILYVNKSSQTKDKKQMVNVYMLTKVAKILSSLVLIAIFAFKDKEHLKNFVIIYIVFYLLYLAIETFMFVKIEKHIKEKMSKNE